jgi:nitrate reductase gamma subunit
LRKAAGAKPSAQSKRATTKASSTTDRPDVPSQQLPTVAEIRAAEGLVLSGDVCRIRLTVTPVGDPGAADPPAEGFWGGTRYPTSKLLADVSDAASVALPGSFLSLHYSTGYWDSLSIDVVAANEPHLDLMLRGYARAGSTRGGAAGTVFEEGILRLLRDLKQKVEGLFARYGRVGVSASWQPAADLSIEAASDYSVERRAREEAAEMRQYAEDLRSQAQRGRAFVLPALLAIAAAIVIATVAIGSWSGVVLTPAAVMLGLVGIGLNVLRTEVRSRETRARTLDAEADLRELLKGKEDERRAQKQFQLQTHELELYYEQALRQRALIFFVGIVCILAGFGTIALAFVLLSDDSITKNLSEKIVVAALGAVSGILANFVAVIFLRMFSATVSSMTAFHLRLVGTHHLHFGNVLAARVTNVHLRDQVLADMARALAVVRNEDREANEEPPAEPKANGKATPLVNSA